MLLQLAYEQLLQSAHFTPKMLDASAQSPTALPRDSLALAILDANNANIGAVLTTISSYISPINTVILSNCTNSALLTHWRSLGFERIVSMDSAFSELLVCLRHARSGEPFHCPMITKLIKNSQRGALSVREHEVFELLVEGSNNKDISIRLGVGEKSVHTYRKRLMEKLSCSSLAELILYAQQSQNIK